MKLELAMDQKIEQPRRKRVDEFFSAKKRRYHGSEPLSIVNKSRTSPTGKYPCTTMDALLQNTENQAEFRNDHPSVHKENNETSSSFCYTRNSEEFPVASIPSNDHCEALDACNKGHAEIKRFHDAQHKPFLLRRCSQGTLYVPHAEATLTLSGELVLVNDKKNNEKFDSSASCPRESGELMNDGETENSGGGSCQKDSIFEKEKQKHELTQFANDFLSICCSGVVSTNVANPPIFLGNSACVSEASCVGNGAEADGNMLRVCTAQTQESEQRSIQDASLAQKPENISYIQNSMNIHAAKVIEDIDKREIPIDVSTQNINETNCMTVSIKSKPLKALNNNANARIGSFESPKVVNESHGQSPSVDTKKIDGTPQSNSFGKEKQNLQWSAGSSLFSPGDEFWDEAINLADTLALPKVNDILYKKQNNATEKIEHPMENKDSHITLSSFTSKDFTKNLESHVNDLETPESNVGPSASKSTHGRIIHYAEAEVSPLPVRRFDFTNHDGVSEHVDGSIENDAWRESPCRLANKSDVGDSMKSQPILNDNGQNIHEQAIANNMNKELHVIPETLIEIKGTSIAAAADQPVIESALEESTSSEKVADVVTKLELNDWLPDVVCSVYAKKGLKKLYPWQVECLQLNGVLEGRNLVYCASTSAGKSLVAEVLMLRQVLTTGKKALLVLPYVSICHEKEAHLTSVLEPLGKKVSSFFGACGGASLPKDSSIAVCTIEKANSLINKLLEEGRLPELALVVIDELHMVGDKDRGYLLELILTKLRYVAGEGNDVTSEISEDKKKYGSLQIVGMSATMPNAAAVSTWLQAALYQTEFRPVPLIEHIKVSNVIYNKDMEIVRTIRKSANLAGKDPDHIVELCNEVVQEGHSVLLFCSSRKACETSAKHVAKFLPHHVVQLRSTIGPESASAALEELQKCPAGLDPVLAETLPRGVAYHHAGLTVEEREIVEACYRSGIVRILTATSTLAAGVNLPARRVIFRQPRIGRDFIDGTRYRQMAGRAGRAGIDTSGESILICKPEELKRMSALLNEGCQPLLSCLAEDKNGMTRAILEVVAGGIVQTANDVERYVKCTLLNSTQTFQDVVKSAQDSLYWLCHRKLLEWDHNTELYSCTPLGKAAFGSSLCPEESLIVFEDLAKAREGFVLASDLHLVYQVTPIYVDLEPDWNLFYKKFIELSIMDQAVGNRVGVMEPFLMRMAHGALTVESRIMKKSPRRRTSPILRGTGKRSPTKVLEQTLRVCRRFFVALILAKLVQEVPLMEICDSFKVSRGMVQSLQENSGRFATMVSSFCERLGWHDLEGLVSKFQSRVSFGVRAEIVELAEIPYVKASRARALYKAGLRTPQSVAEATIPELVKALFDTSSWGPADGTNAVMKHRMHIGMARKIQNGARKLVLERAEAARIAAFSALRSLGIDVPAALSQSLAENSALARKKIELDETCPGQFPIELEESTKASGLSVINEVSSDPKPHSSNEPQPQNGIILNSAVHNGPVDVDKMDGGFDEFFSIWQAKSDFFFDFHFLPCMDSASPLVDVKGIAICWMGSPIYYVKFWEISSSKNNQQASDVLYEQAKGRWKKLETIFSKKGVVKITWNLQSQSAAFKHPSLCLVQEGLGQRIYGIFEPGTTNRQRFHLQGLTLVEPLVDLKIAAWLLWPDEESSQGLSLEQEVKKRLPGNVIAKANRDGRWTNQMDQVAHNGCCRRVSQIRALHSIIWKLLTAEGLEQPLLQQEMPLVLILSEMEAYGVRVDMEGCKCARGQLDNKIKQLEAKAHELAGVAFSLAVPAEVASVLYTHLKLPVPTGCNKGKHHPSTDKQALDALMGQHPIVEIIKEHRTLSKVLNGTLGSILYKARPIVATDAETGGGRSIVYHVKGRWLQTSTATGRLSMEEPNLQCVEHPLHFSVVQQFEGYSDKRHSVDCTINPRDFFIPYKDDWVLLSADYSQIEVRLMAHFSGDSSLIELLSIPSGDLFKIITARWTGVAEKDVTATQREHTKRLVYGILYGMGVNALAEQLECSVAEAADKYNRFKAAFPGVANWLKEAVKNCREKGYISTLSGRKRYLDKIKCGNASERSKAERQAVNSVCQGSAADLIKVAMIKLVSTEECKKANSRIVGKYNLLLQIHDELILEVDRTVVQEVGAWLRSCMENAANLKVPLRVKLKSGPKWGSLQPMDIE